MATYDSSVTFYLNGDEIYAFHVPPAHTDGDSIIRFKKADVIHMGDVFFNGNHPFVDLSSGGSVQGVHLARELRGDDLRQPHEDEVVVCPASSDSVSGEDFASLARRADAGVAGSTSRRRNATSGVKGRQNASLEA